MNVEKKSECGGSHVLNVLKNKKIKVRIEQGIVLEETYAPTLHQMFQSVSLHMWENAHC